MHLNENRNSNDVPKDCQLQYMALFSAAYLLNFLMSGAAFLSNVACRILSLYSFCVTFHYLSSHVLKTLLEKRKCRDGADTLVWGVCVSEGMWF